MGEMPGNHAHSQRHIQRPTAAHYQRSQQPLSVFSIAIVKENHASQQRTRNARAKVPDPKAGRPGQTHTEDQQFRAEPRGRTTRDAARGQRTLRALFQVTLVVEHVVKHHAAGVERGRREQQQGQSYGRLQSGDRHDEQHPHRHVGHRREEVRQADQLGAGLDLFEFAKP